MTADVMLAGIVSRTLRPSPGRSSITLPAIADEGEEAARVAIVERAPNGAMFGQQSC